MTVGRGKYSLPLMIERPQSDCSVAFVQRVLEVVGVLPVGDFDCHLAGQSCQFAGAGVRYDRDRQLRRAARHGASVLEYEGAAAAMQGYAYLFDRDVAG